jgi:hypothetical protein
VSVRCISTWDVERGRGTGAYHDSVVPGEYRQLIQTSDEIPPSCGVAGYEYSKSEDRERVHEFGLDGMVAARRGAVGGGLEAGSLERPRKLYRGADKCFGGCGDGSSVVKAVHEHIIVHYRCNGRTSWCCGRGCGTLKPGKLHSLPWRLARGK